MTVTEDFIAEVRGEVDQTLDKLLPAADVVRQTCTRRFAGASLPAGKPFARMIVIAAG